MNPILASSVSWENVSRVKSLHDLFFVEMVLAKDNWQLASIWARCWEVSEKIGANAQCLAYLGSSILSRGVLLWFIEVSRVRGYFERYCIPTVTMWWNSWLYIHIQAHLTDTSRCVEQALLCWLEIGTGHSKNKRCKEHCSISSEAEKCEPDPDRQEKRWMATVLAVKQPGLPDGNLGWSRSLPWTEINVPGAELACIRLMKFSRRI